MAEGLRFGPLSEVPAADLVRLLNDPDVRRHMPLADGRFDDTGALDWARGKDAQWQQNGFGPWAIQIGPDFAGWGGFQQEGDEADLALVLFPRFWGRGATLFRELLRRGRDIGLGTTSILLPPSRSRVAGLQRLGFVPAGEVSHAGQRFRKFRMVQAEQREQAAPGR
jgi:hypothetical protein